MIKPYEFGTFNAIEIKRIVGTGVEVDYLTLDADNNAIAREGVYTIDPFELTEEEIEQLNPIKDDSIS